MKTHKKLFLLDTSIQIKRLISRKWREAKHDNVWADIDPATCYYSFMEFKNTVIAALEFLANVINQIPEEKSKVDSVEIRLEEVINELNIDSTIRERNRRVKLANLYAVKILKENTFYKKLRTKEDVLLQIKNEANNLEEFGFFYFHKNGKSRKIKLIDHINCHLGKRMSVFTNGRSAFTCKKGVYDCRISQFIQEKKVAQNIIAIADKKLKINDSRLKKGAIAINNSVIEGKLQKGKSIGQRMCFPIGDCIIVSKAQKFNTGIFTVDRDQEKLSRHLNIPVLLYNVKNNKIV